MLFIRDSWLTMRRSSERVLTLMAASSQKNTSEQALIAQLSCESASLDKIESRVPYTVFFTTKYRSLGESGVAKPAECDLQGILQQCTIFIYK